MLTTDNIKELQGLVAGCTGIVLYSAMSGEVDCTAGSFPIQLGTDARANRQVVPSNPSTDPFDCAEQCTAKFKSSPVCVFVPGAQFDLAGTRHGRGGGWYDRFLSKVPRTWMRIGVAHEHQVSTSPLLRQSWDEPVDWLIVQNVESWRIHKITP